VAEIDVQKALHGLADAIATALAPERREPALAATILKTTAHATTLKVEIGGKAGVLKLFHPDEAGRGAFQRARRALEGMQALTVPRLLLVSERDAALLSAFIPGALLGARLEPTNLAQMAEFAGQWFGRLATIAPRAPAEGSWGDYLARFETGFARDLLEQQKPLLDSLGPDHLALAHNDNALSNFILARDRRLYGVDFEDTRLKPEGWDLITSASAFFRRFPDDLPVISNSLLRGFRLTNAACHLPNRFDQLINVLVLAAALDRA